MKEIKFNMNFILIFIIFPEALFGQLSGIGIGAGGSVSTFDYGDQINSVQEFDNNNKAGGTGGIRFDFDLGSESFKLSPEVFIVQNGSKEFYQDFSVLQNDLINRKVSLDYVGLYIPFTIYLPIDDGTGITEDFYNGFLLQGRLFGDYVINGTIDNEILGESEVNFATNTDKIDYGYSFEAGFVIRGMKLMIGYNWGIKNIEFTNALGDVDSEDYLINNKGLTVQLGFIQKISR